MKITKAGLKQIIKEELRSVMVEESESLAAGDFVEIRVSDDGYETSVEKVDPNEYENSRGGAWGPSLKALAKVVKVAPDPYTEAIQPRPAAHKDLESIMISIKKAYDSQSSDEEKEQFENFLIKNINNYVKVWRDERSGAGTDREASAQEWRRIKRFTSDIRRLVNRALTSPPQRTPPPEPEEALENAIELTKMAAKEEFAPLVDKAAEEYKKSVAWEKILADFE